MVRHGIGKKEILFRLELCRQSEGKTTKARVPLLKSHCLSSALGSLLFAFSHELSFIWSEKKIVDYPLRLLSNASTISNVKTISNSQLKVQ